MCLPEHCSPQVYNGLCMLSMREAWLIIITGHCQWTNKWCGIQTQWTDSIYLWRKSINLHGYGGCISPWWANCRIWTNRLSWRGSVIQYNPREYIVKVPAGENVRRTLPHRDVVHTLMKIGIWEGGEATFKLPKLDDENYKAAVIVQKERGGPIVGAAKV